jgi:DNA/RNA-binding domain of Phe-tRNA-synthetase-like protein
MYVRLHPEISAIVAPAVIAFDDVTVTERDSRMDAPIEATARHLGSAATLEPVISAVRSMYRRLGIDPTKTRPSSEALLRRVRKGEGLPRVNSLVDICNWCSVETQLPFGLYDAGRIEGDVVALRTGAVDEGYAGIRKDWVNVAGRLTLADDRGPFGNPTSDSARTMVTLATRHVLFVIFSPPAVLDARERAVALTASRMVEFTGAPMRRCEPSTCSSP